MKPSTRARPTDPTRLVLEMARQAEAHLSRELATVNGLNVFPVPDGDTGSNMLATIQAALASPEGLASGALLGARGNSGVILSQLFRAQAAAPDPLDMRAVFGEASRLAGAAMSQPVEGTMLSVLEALASVDSIQEAVAVAEAAVARTPDQLAILREAGVVDSGAYGLLLVLRGWHEAVTGEAPPPIEANLLGLDRAGSHPATLVPRPASGYGYCVTLTVAGSAAEAAVRQRLAGMGDSVLVVATGGRLKLHAHVPDPEPLQAYAAELGEIVGSEISHIDEQTATAPALPIVAVAPGEGFAEVFRGLGAATVFGGPGHNPSTADLLAACRRVLEAYGHAFLVPNNRNVEAAAQQAASADPRIVVVPTRTAPQGVAAALAYSDDNALEHMTAAASSVLTAELVRAAREATISGITVHAGDCMVVLDGELLPSLEVLVERAAGKELATIYYGAGASRAAAEQLAAELTACEIEIVRGDQPHAEFIISFE